MFLSWSEFKENQEERYASPWFRSFSSLCSAETLRAYPQISDERG
ncbi:MAG: hypothetical protein HDT15_02685 [Oscillibacter sp.]|nr:hypothetical protein [Oscillibacter sp.]